MPHSVPPAQQAWMAHDERTIGIRRQRRDACHVRRERSAYAVRCVRAAGLREAEAKLPAQHRHACGGIRSCASRRTAGHVRVVDISTHFTGGPRARAAAAGTRRTRAAASRARPAAAGVSRPAVAAHRIGTGIAAQAGVGIAAGILALVTAAASKRQRARSGDHRPGESAVHTVGHARWPRERMHARLGTIVRSPVSPIAI